MARTKVQIEVGELQSAITQLESTKLFSSPHKLYEAIAQTPWARALGATAVMIYLRVKEVNVDPDNPVLIMKVKAARKVGPRDPNAPSATRPATAKRAKVAGVTFAGLDVLIDVFQGRGIEVDSVEWLVASSQKSDAENRAIRLAWSDLRDRLALPKPVKKSDAHEGEDLVKAPVVFTTTESEDGAGIPDGVLPDTMTTRVTPEVTEQMPDGGPVSSQPVVEAEPEIPLATPKPVVPGVAPVPTQAQVRPVQPRPMPVRSSVPPRPMPVATEK